MAAVNGQSDASDNWLDEKKKSKADEQALVAFETWIYSAAAHSMRPVWIPVLLHENLIFVDNGIRKKRMAFLAPPNLSTLSKRP